MVGLQCWINQRAGKRYEKKKKNGSTDNRDGLAKNKQSYTGDAGVWYHIRGPLVFEGNRWAVPTSESQT